MAIVARIPFLGLGLIALLWPASTAGDPPLATPPPRDGLLTSQTSPFAPPQDPHLRKLLADYRRDWARLTGLQFSGMHWGQSVIVFVNQAKEIYKHNHLTYLREFEEADEDETYSYKPYPVGTIFVKENFLAQVEAKTQALTLAVMIKHEPGFDPALGDWEFIQIGRDGQTIAQGASSKDPAIANLCGNCHQNLANRDFIFHTAGP